MIKLLKKKIIKKEISILHFLVMTTSKLLIGIGLGILIVNYYWFLHPYWYIIILIGSLILIPTLYYLTITEEKEEIKLKKELKK